MSIRQLLLGGGGGVVSGFVASNIAATAAPGVLATASYSVNSDGSISTLATPSDGGSSIGSTAWHKPVASGVGNAYWVRFTPTSGTLTTNDAVGFTALSSSRSVTKGNTTGTNSCTFTIDIATDSGGTNIVLTSTGNIVRNDHV